jgi:hypothetical protein
MDPAWRSLLMPVVAEALKLDPIFSLRMDDLAAPRHKLIASNALQGEEPGYLRPRAS